MAKVYTGKVVIPGDKIDEYLRLLRAAEERKAPFREVLVGLQGEFHDYLRAKYTEHTARKHADVIQMFVEFLCTYTDVQAVEEVTRGVVNTHFKKWWKRKVWDSTTPDDLRVALRKFFRFLAAEKGIVNDKALKALG